LAWSRRIPVLRTSSYPPLRSINSSPYFQMFLPPTSIALILPRLDVAPSLSLIGVRECSSFYPVGKVGLKAFFPSIWLLVAYVHPMIIKAIRGGGCTPGRSKTGKPVDREADSFSLLPGCKVHGLGCGRTRDKGLIRVSAAGAQHRSRAVVGSR